MSVEQTKEKLRSILLGIENGESSGLLPEWATAIFSVSSEIEVWVRPGAQNIPPIPDNLDGVPIKVKMKGPGIAC